MRILRFGGAAGLCGRHFWRRGLLLAFAGLAAAVVVLADRPRPLHAQAGDWRQNLPGFEMFRRAPQHSSEEERQRRRQVRNELAERMEAELRTREPLFSQATVDGLQRAITHHQAIVEGGGFPTIPEGTYRVGDSGEAITLLRRRLELSGDLRHGSGAPWQFDAALQEAVARFQMRHGLRVSGLVDKRTLQSMNVPAHERLRQLQINMNRMMERADIAQAERFVIVNSASYELEAIERGQLALRSNVVVGKPGRETPDVSTKIVELNFFPYWHVPESIANRDLIPTLRKDPGYFAREQFSVMKAWGTPPIDASAIDWNSPSVHELKFRQDPGPQNALGLLRINMPNKHAVYLHDTPLKQLFGQSSRAFSSGCVRVERVFDLAAWLLQSEPDWGPQRIRATLEDNLPLDVKLKQPVPVHFLYITAWANPDGLAHFRPDIYRRDGLSVMVAEDEEAPKSDAITP